MALVQLVRIVRARLNLALNQLRPARRDIKAILAADPNSPQVCNRSFSLPYCFFFLFCSSATLLVVAAGPDILQVQASIFRLMFVFFPLGFCFWLLPLLSLPASLSLLFESVCFFCVTAGYDCVTAGYDRMTPSRTVGLVVVRLLGNNAHCTSMSHLLLVA